MYIPYKRTKIVCTIGPASASPEIMEQLIHAGMNIARLNFSHGTYEEHAKLMATIRNSAKKLEQPVAILQDLQGPKIRVGELPEEGIKLVKGEQIILSATTDTAKNSIIPVSYPNLHKDVKVGQKLLFDDGKLSVTVKEVQDDKVICTVFDGGILLSHKGLNLPETDTKISGITEKDKSDLAFGIAQDVDFIALSFVRSADDVRQLRGLIEDEQKKLGKKPVTPIRIISKIEKPQGVEHFGEILEASDAIMVARGDLGIEVPAARVPILQKEMIIKCLKAAKPVIVATQMLESMTTSPRATRAEVSDVENAVIDHTDAVMLSGETASGLHPLEAVQTMAAAVKEAEKSHYDDLAVPFSPETKGSVAHLIAGATNLVAALVVSVTGQAARVVARYRPEVPILVAVQDERLARQLLLSWGVSAVVMKEQEEGKALENLKSFIQKAPEIAEGGEVLVALGDHALSVDRVRFAEVQRINPQM